MFEQNHNLNSSPERQRTAELNDGDELKFHASTLGSAVAGEAKARQIQDELRGAYGAYDQLPEHHLKIAQVGITLAHFRTSEAADSDVKIG